MSNIYVKNVNVAVTEEELRKHFSQCGTITSTKLMCDEKGKSKGFGFVCFSTPEEAIDAVKTFHGKPHDHNLLVYKWNYDIALGSSYHMIIFFHAS